MYIAYINIYNTRYFIGLYKAKKYIEVLDTWKKKKKPEYKQILEAFNIAEDQHKKQNAKTSKRVNAARKINKNYGRPVKSYMQKKEHARQLAQHWQANFSRWNHSYQWCVNWSGRFQRIGKKYGLLREFRENFII